MPEYPENPGDVSDEMDIFNIDRFGETLKYIYQITSIDEGETENFECWDEDVVGRDEATEIALSGEDVEIYIAPSDDGATPSGRAHIALVFRSGQLTDSTIINYVALPIFDEAKRLLARVGRQTPEEITALFAIDLADPI